MAWKITLQNGIHLPEVALHCDALRKVPLSFISHAHSDHIGLHATVICSEGTKRLLRERLKGEREIQVIPFGERHVLLPDVAMQLYPVGHILGSSQLWLERAGESILYTGDFKLKHGLSTEVCATPRADVVIMETTFGVPRYVLPPVETVRAEILAFCREAIALGAVPVLWAYSLGKSQELLRIFEGAELPILIHAQTAKMTRVYESLGVTFPEYGILGEETALGHVVICPPQGKAEKALEGVTTRTAVVTGWAMDSSAKYRFGCDAAFALSDHADYPDLLKFVELVQPKRVYTVHGFAREFAATLRRIGVEAWALGRENQLELQI